MVQGIPKKYREYVVTDPPKFLEVTGLHKLSPFWIIPEMFPGVHMRIAGACSSLISLTPYKYHPFTLCYFRKLIFYYPYDNIRVR